MVTALVAAARFAVPIDTGVIPPAVVLYSPADVIHAVELSNTHLLSRGQQCMHW